MVFPFLNVRPILHNLPSYEYDTYDQQIAIPRFTYTVPILNPFLIFH